MTSWPRPFLFIALAALASFSLPEASFAEDNGDRDSAPKPTEKSAERSQASESARKVDFIKEVQPILADHCYACHGPDTAESGLAFTSREAAYAETDSGERAIVPHDVEASMLLHRITTDDEFERMPPEGDPVSEQEIAVLRRWIEEGAPWDKHWAFKPMQRYEPPAVAEARWSENPIDAFLYDAMQQQGLEPNPPADRATLIRRAYYDLTGLPPSYQQVQSFIDDPDPLAFEKLIDELLSSHHYGERWGRHWLDLVRYAETNSFERDGAKPNAWKYRDYVIKSFNKDKPYDQFLREQLAGDELDNVTPETLTATGYYRLGIWDDEPADPLQARFDEMDDIIMTTGQAMLGLTINCARCHDHKIDPIPQADYYSMLALMADVTSWGTRGDQRSNNQIDVSPPELKAKYAANDQAKRRLEGEIHAIEQKGIAKMSGPDQRATEGPKRERNKVLKQKLQDHLSEAQWQTYRELKKELDEVIEQGKQLPPREMVMGLAKTIREPKQTFVMYRGNPHSPADPVEPSFPTIFDAPPPTDFESTEDSPGRRRALAEWMTGPDNMLTARVMANRIWQFHFGRGIVRSSNNFGQLGTPPTHPKLLDWLALRFIDGNWKMKSMHRLIMTSQAYQMASTANPDAMARDPNNDLFWRFDPRRLSAEEVRDSLLAVNETLNRKPYGPSMYPELSQEVLAGQSRPGSGWGDSSEEERNRRSIYIHVKRSLLTPLLTAFDFPDPDLTCEARFATLQPGQALALLNSDFVHEQARRLAESIDAENSANEDVVRETVRAVLAREANEAEIADGAALITTLQNDRGLSRSRAVQLYCLTVLNWNEFLFVD